VGHLDLQTDLSAHEDEDEGRVVPLSEEQATGRALAQPRDTGKFLQVGVTKTLQGLHFDQFFCQ
jgi:hypothetical protein